MISRIPIFLDKQFRKVYIFPFLLFAGTTTLIIFSWFRFGHLYGGGDVGLPSYDPSRIYEITKNIWWEASAPGTTVAQGLTSVPLQYFQSRLQYLGLPPFLIQAIVFWIVLFLSGFGMYLLALTVFGKDKFYLAILSGLLYMFNPFMMVQVWHRFIHNAFFLSASLPFLFMFFSSWIRTGKYLSLLLFLLTNFISVYMYGTIAFIVTILLLLFLIGLSEVLFPWKSYKNFLSISFRFILGIVVWLAVHSWWLLPVLNVAPAVLSTQHSVVDNLSTLLSISSQTIIPYSLLGINPFYLYIQSDFSKIYSLHLFRALPYLTLLFLIPGFFIALRTKKLFFWTLLSVVGLFLAKGATDPFGYPYVFGFTNFFPLGVLRNPFEKLGILLPFSYAILIPVGIQWYLDIVKKRNTFFVKIFVLIILFLTMGVNLWPMWLGSMFGKYNKPAFISIPDSYLKADEYINKQNKTGKILHLPLTVNESINYNWEYGYVGVEPSQLLFKSLPSISHGFNQGIVDDALTGLSYVFILPESDDKVLSFLQSFNIRFVVLHKDVKWQGGYLPEPELLEKRLDQLTFLKNKIKYGELIVYEIKDEFYYPKIRILNNINYFIPSEANLYWPWLLTSNEADFLSPIAKETKDLLVGHSSELLVSPEHVYKFSPEKVVKENLLGEMPAAKILPDSPLYFFIRLKEAVQGFTLPINSKFSFKVTLAGKRLTESYLLKKKSSSESIVPLLSEYKKVMDDLRKGIKERSNGQERRGEISINFIMLRHLALLDLIFESANFQEKEILEKVRLDIASLMKESNILSYNEILENNELSLSNRLVSRFNLPTEGKYELLQAHQQSQEIYPANLELNTFQINSEIKTLYGHLQNSFISYGLIDLPAGLNEISFNAIPSRNLVNMENLIKTGNVIAKDYEMEITSGQNDPAYLEFEINPVNGGAWYQLIFDSWIKLGDKFKIQVIQDTDPYDPENPQEKLYSYDTDFPKDTYRSYWVENLFHFYIKPTTTKASVRLFVPPWDGCRFVQQIKSLCQSRDLKYRYEQPSTVTFRSIKVIRELNNPIFLKKVLNNQSGQTKNNTVSFMQKTPTYYSGKLKLESPAFLTFSETFHPKWELILIQNGISKKINAKFLSNLYGNAWYVEEPGEYDFTLAFTPEENTQKGIIISIICFFSVLILFFVQRKNKNV